MRSQRVLVDARAIHHGTAGGRGIGNYTAGLIRGLVDVGASVTALVSGRDDLALVESQIGRPVVSIWHPDVVRAASDAWYVATGMFLAPIAFDPIPRIVTDAGMPVVGIMYDVIPLRHPELYFDNDAAIRQAAVRGHLARTVDVTAAISQFSADTAIEHLGLDAAFRHRDRCGCITQLQEAVVGPTPIRRRGRDGTRPPQEHRRPHRRVVAGPPAAASSPSLDDHLRWSGVDARPMAAPRRGGRLPP